ncbi:hypothetical protein MASR2M78_33220 [Treponema sp.]
MDMFMSLDTKGVFSSSRTAYLVKLSVGSVYENEVIVCRCHCSWHRFENQTLGLIYDGSAGNLFVDIILSDLAIVGGALSLH